MPGFGQCSEPLCNEIAVRLFDCAHHCMKLVCLQHLIEHDQWIEHNQQYLNNLRSELRQLWTTYSSLIDETKLFFEFEQKLKKHQQLIRDLTDLFENDSINNIEHYHIMLEILKQNIEHLNQYSTGSFPRTEEIKTEPGDKITTTDELIDSLDINTVIHIESNDIEQQKSKSTTATEYDHQTNNSCESSKNETISSQTNNHQSIRKLSGKCPLWFDGAFGLTQEFHGMYLCSDEKSYQVLYDHFRKFHKLKTSTAEILCQAIQNHEDPNDKILFQSNDSVIDQINHFHCPFSIHNKFSLINDNPSTCHCRTIKPQYSYKLRYHLIHFHQMTLSNANKLISQLKNP